jgi:hypothetical protein
MQSFDSKWVQGSPAGERLLGTSDIQSLADLGTSFDVVQRMRIAPISRQAVIQCAVLAGLPFLLLLLMTTPVDKVLGALLKVFL